jgi:hypothetical protein
VCVCVCVCVCVFVCVCVCDIHMYNVPVHMGVCMCVSGADVCVCAGAAGYENVFPRIECVLLDKMCVLSARICLCVTLPVCHFACALHMYSRTSVHLNLLINRSVRADLRARACAHERRHDPDRVGKRGHSTAGYTASAALRRCLVCLHVFRHIRIEEAGIHI